MYLNICTTVDKILEKVIFEQSAAANNGLRSLSYKVSMAWDLEEILSS